MKRPEFTKEQEDWMCEVVGDWYLSWKNRMCENDGTHNLGRAKEMLKAMLCHDMATLIHDSEFFNIILPELEKVE